MVKNFLIPTIVDKTPSWERAYDIYSRLLEDRIVFLWDAIDSDVANTVIAQLLFLEKQDPKAPITMYINSPGWHVTAGLAIYDTMQYISCPVHTVSLWLSASMWAIVLVWWEKWKRFALPHSEIMIHQPHGWYKISSWAYSKNLRHFIQNNCKTYRARCKKSRERLW